MRFVKIALAAAALLPLASYAALGGAPGTDPAPQMRLRSATSNSSSAAVAAYTVRESRDADGVTIREYVLPANIVFAVTWQGPVRPDMAALLGSYFSSFASAGQAHARGTGPLIEHNDGFHVESAGRPGHFFGKAYLPRMVPTHVRMDELQ
ncbi:hypothetical protein LMG24238_04754 [Paraburkholderia sediminicola]|uniref:DUF2844 domain-containing protein n=1 Tax=Paraburkholderia sediminicola TaxID=458836 RepID=A0A6J5BYI2_9BURK|nr:DUF2844 domain-containing protein [Paraburkholderia sediminicola]CAB3719459.1 hypothetical protein LMG24238_04754 [Paraburkholderia sediminicola]